MCQQYENLKGNVFLSSELNFNHEIKCFFLMYHREKLVSFLSMFIPTSREAEISAYTLPIYRHQGYFKALLQKAIEQLKTHRILEILFVHENVGNNAKSVLKKLNASYEYSEYVLFYKQKKFVKNRGQLILEQLPKEKVNEVISLNMDVFEKDFEEAESSVIKSMNSKEIISYVVILKDEIIGVCNVNFEGKDVSIFRLGISPSYQGKGYGKEMLNLLLERLIGMGIKDITLEVDSTNNRAYNLYIKSGFEIKTQFDYYRYLL